MARQKTIPVVQMVLLDFDSLARQSDEDIVRRFLFYYQTTKGLFKKSVRFDGFRVSRQPAALTVDLMLGEVRSAQFSFFPPPDFSRVQHQAF
jgi:hypothetical protein